MKMIRKTLAGLLTLILLAGAASAEGYLIDQANQGSFRKLFSLLQSAYETPSGDDGAAIDAAVEAIRRVNADDGDLAEAIAGHWKAVYLDRGYRLCFFRPETGAEELTASDPPIGRKHAFIVLGYQLQNGQMTEELEGRCRAAAAAAKAYPDSILICSGGATGPNNPDRKTEAGLMKRFLVFRCGIDASRILTDEKAMTTLENAENTFAILREREIETITIVTSGYHQRWGQVLYNGMAVLYEKQYGYTVRIAGNFCYDTEPENDSFRRDDRIALSQLAGMLGIRSGN